MTQRVALVTGAMGGIGTAICQELAKAGHKVVAAYHPEFDKPAEWTKAMEEAGFKDFICVAGDVSDYDSCVALAAEAEAQGWSNRHSGQQRGHHSRQDVWPDGVVPVECCDLDKPDQPLQHDQTGFGEDGRAWLGPDHKHLVGQWSSWSSRPNQLLGRQGGRDWFHQGTRRRTGAKNVTVNAICPGYVATPMVMAIKPEILQGIVDTVPMKRLAKPEEIGGACAYLASDIAGFMTGSTMNICGGLYYQ
jgi:acetoacetyl-CoA reductase